MWFINRRWGSIVSTGTSLKLTNPKVTFSKANSTIGKRQLLSRRQVLAMIALTPLLGWGLFGKAKSTTGYGAFRDADGGFGIAAINLQAGAPLFYTPMPGRAHDLVLSPDSDHLLCMSRRPGTYLSVIDANHGQVITQQTAAKGRHFYGHGCFSADGRYLFTTENAYDEARGVIGVREVNRGYQQVAEWDAHGIGPHQLNLSANGVHVIVAIGGIQTHPKSGREKLNLDSMQSALVYLNAKSGEIIARYTLPEAQSSLSIRHMAVTKNGLVGLAFQDQDDFSRHNTLVGFHQLGQPIQPQAAEDTIQYQMRGYCASITTDVSGRWFAVTSPRGNMITLWYGASQSYINFASLRDCSGIAPTDLEGEFVVTSGRGKVMLINAKTGKQRHLSHANPTENMAWDNHFITHAV
jgi:hypothetical protein